ncbi:MAG TPA: biopolymer transporter ExbD [Candidatus Krumholzibacteria bacterium]|nr:biopolymer transporter ExbD [Candidatus Krumholzibacteria bacterium]
MQKPFIPPSETVAKINVTPIIDVALVLVIILMVTAPMIALSDVDVSLPPAETRSLEGAHRVTLTVGRGGELAVDDTDVTRAQLFALLAQRLKETGEDAVLVVRADEGIAYATVEELLAEARRAGAMRVAIATRQRGNRNE